VQLADPPIGILLVLALSVDRRLLDHARRLVDGSKYPLLGAVRATRSWSARGGARAQRRAGLLSPAR
jgi:hypothetical protein